MSTKCIICNRSKGKRECKLYDGRLVCPHCCGENRGGRCEGCRYYQTSIQYHTTMEKGDWKGAIKGFERAIRWHPGLAQPYGNMGICHAKLGNKQAALAAFENVLISGQVITYQGDTAMPDSGLRADCLNVFFGVLSAGLVGLEMA